VGWDRGHPQSGQAKAEYALIIGVIALACILAALFLGLALRERFESGGEQVPAAPFTPPVSSTPQSWPTTLAECEDGGWRNFPQFASEAECREYVDGLTP
jgi:Flp pilus assembly pilin Flp